MTELVKGETRMYAGPTVFELEYEIVGMLKAAAPVPVSTRELTDALPRIPGVFRKVHHCPTCECGTVYEEFFYTKRTGGCRQPNSRVTPILKRFVKAGQVERFHASVKGQPDGWRWIG